MNDLAPRFGGGTGLISRDDLARSLNNVATAAPRVGGDKQYLKMDKGNGDWVYGQEETVVEDGSLWAINPASLTYGYIAWPPEEAQVRDPEGEIMVSISRPLPDVASLRTTHPDGKTTGAGWQFQQSVDLVCVTGEDVGVECQYKQSSVGARKLFASLTDAIAGQLAKGSDAIVPIIRLKSDSYKHKKWGRIYNPLFEIVEWRTMDDSSKPGGATQTAAKPAEAPADEAEEAEIEQEYVEAQAEASPAPRRRVRR